MNGIIKILKVLVVSQDVKSNLSAIPLSTQRFYGMGFDVDKLLDSIVKSRGKYDELEKSGAKRIEARAEDECN